MEARELRIGNYVNYEQTTHVIKSIDRWQVTSLWMKPVKKQGQKIGSYTICDEDLYEHKLSTIEPIKLTEEWLKKFGYEPLETWEEISNPTEQNEELIKFHDVKKYTHKDCRSIYVIVELNEIYVYITPRDYLGKIPVHRFQNIHLSISGKELTIK